MTNQIAKKIIIYKIPSKEINDRNIREMNSFVSSSARHPYVYLVSKEENQEYAALSEDVIRLDGIFYAKENDKKRALIAFPKNFEHEFVRLSDKKARKMIENRLSKIDDVSPEKLESHAQYLKDLAKKKKPIILDKSESMFILQLPEEGWSIPRNYPWAYPFNRYTVPSMTKLKNYNLIDYLPLKGENNFVKLTKTGIEARRSIANEMKNIFEKQASREFPEGMFPSVFEIK